MAHQVLFIIQIIKGKQEVGFKYRYLAYKLNESKNMLEAIDFDIAKKIQLELIND